MRPFLPGLGALFLREMLSLWVTPLAWILLFAFLLLQGLSFYLVVDHFSHFADVSIDEGPIQSYFSSFFVPFSILFVSPLLTMGSFAEERRTGTIEALLSAPVTATSVVFAKFAAAWATYCLLWLPTLLYIVVVRNLGEVDAPVLLTSYAAIGGIGGAFLGVGLLMSSLTHSQLAAAMLSLLVLFGLFIVGVGERVFDPGALHDVCAQVSLLSQLDEMSRGIVDSRRIVFDGSLCALSIFLTVRVVDSWRWG